MIQEKWNLEFQRQGAPSHEVFCEHIIADTFLRNKAALDIIDLLKEAELQLEQVDRVVSASEETRPLAHDVAQHIGCRTGRLCLCACSRKDESSRFLQFDSPMTCERTLVVGGAVTVGPCVHIAGQTAFVAGAKPLLYVGALVNLSGKERHYGYQFVSLLR